VDSPIFTLQAQVADSSTPALSGTAIVTIQLNNLIEVATRESVR